MVPTLLIYRGFTRGINMEQKTGGQKEFKYICCTVIEAVLLISFHKIYKLKTISTLEFNHNDK